MTADTGGCNCRGEGSKVEFEMKRGGDLKDNGIACRDGEEIRGSFVIVNGDPDNNSDRDLDLERNLDLRLKSENGEIGGKEESLVEDEKFGEEKQEMGEELIGESLIGSGSDIKVEPGRESKLDSDAQIEREEVEVDNVKLEDVEKEDDLVVVEEEESGEVLGVEAEEEEEEEVLPREEREREADVVIGESDSKLGSEIKKEDVEEPETVVTETNCLGEEQETVSLVAEASDEADAGLIDMEESQKPVDVVGETENAAEIQSAVEAEPKQQPHTVIQEIDNVAEIESSVDVELKQEPDAVVEVTDKAEVEENEEPEVVVEEKNSQAEMCSAVEVEPRQERETVLEAADNVAEFESGIDVELKQEPNTGVEETEKLAELGAAVEVDLKPEYDTVVDEMDEAEVQEDKEPKVMVEENNNQAEIRSSVEVEPGEEPETVLEVADKIEAEERKEPEDVVPVDTASKHLPLENGVAGIQNASYDAPTDESSGQLSAEISGDSLRDELNSEAKDITLENSKNPCMSHVAEKELVEEVSNYTEDKHVELEVSNGGTVPSEPRTDISSEDIEPRSSGLVSGVHLEPQAGEFCPNKDTDVETRDSVEDVETNKDVAVVGIKLESESGNESAEGSECMVSSIEGDQSTKKDDDEGPIHEQAQAAEMMQASSENHVVKRHQVFMIKVPRFIDDELQKKIQHAMEIVEEKTEIRNSIGEETRKQAVIVNKYSLDYKAELAKERAARAIFNAKRKEVETVQEVISRINNANSIVDIDERIRNIVHRQQHETISLKQEKQYIQDINQMKRQREQLSSKKGSQEQIDDALKQRDEIEARFKDLTKELDTQRAALSAAESSTKSAWNKYIDEEQRLANLKEKHNAADGVRQEAYLHWRKLRDQSAEKTKYFKMYKADQSAAANYIFSGDNQGLRSHCSRQVERIMDLWNNNTEFRKQYVKSNIYSTLRRLGTPDGRSLGPGEETPVLRSHVDKSSDIISAPSSNIETPAPVLVSEARKGNITEPSATKQVERTNQSAKLKFSTKPTLAERSMPAVSKSEESKEEAELNKLKKEEEEQARKAEELARKEEELRKEKDAKEEELRKEKGAKEEELRKEKAAAELKEQLRLDQKAKAKEAVERKRRKAEKAQAKAEYRAQKEAEFKEKKKSKKENKKSGIADMTSGGSERGSNIPDTNPSETSQELESASGASSSSRKRSARPSTSMRQYNKLQAPLPLPLRNRGKRKITTWMWALLVFLLVLVLFLAGNYISFSTSSLAYFSF